MWVLIKAGADKSKGKSTGNLNAAAGYSGMKKMVILKTFSLPAVGLKTSELLFVLVFV